MGSGRSLRILCADKLEATALQSLHDAGHDVISQPEITGDTLIGSLQDNAPHLLVVRSTKVPAAALSASPGLELVVRAGAGVDNIDLEAAATAGVRRP